MTGDRIETFLTLCRLMNYRRTAEELNMTQPAVTQHIHYLEERYGCRLFLYDRRTLKMTPEAEALKKYAETAGCTVRDVEHIIKQYSKMRQQMAMVQRMGGMEAIMERMKKQGN